MPERFPRLAHLSKLYNETLAQQMKQQSISMEQRSIIESRNSSPNEDNPGTMQDNRKIIEESLRDGITDYNRNRLDHMLSIKKDPSFNIMDIIADAPEPRPYDYNVKLHLLKKFTEGAKLFNKGKASDYPRLLHDVVKMGDRDLLEHMHNHDQNFFDKLTHYKDTKLQVHLTPVGHAIYRGNRDKTKYGEVAEFFQDKYPTKVDSQAKEIKKIPIWRNLDGERDFGGNLLWRNIPNVSNKNTQQQTPSR